MTNTTRTPCIDWWQYGRYQSLDLTSARRLGKVGETPTFRPHPGPGEEKSLPRASGRSGSAWASLGPAPHRACPFRGMEPQDTFRTLYDFPSFLVSGARRGCLKFGRFPVTNRFLTVLTICRGLISEKPRRFSWGAPFFC